MNDICFAFCLKEHLLNYIKFHITWQYFLYRFWNVSSFMAIVCGKCFHSPKLCHRQRGVVRGSSAWAALLGPVAGRCAARCAVGGGEFFSNGERFQNEVHLKGTNYVQLS